MIAGALALSVVSALAWIYLLLFRGNFWLAIERDGDISANDVWPAVTAVVPARDEADNIAAAIGSLLKQDYPGPFRIVLVDDQSADKTAEIAHALDSSGRLTVLSGAPLPSGWTGKLWAVKQGIARAREDAPDYLWLTDADIVHTPDNLRSLVARAQSGKLVLVSLMAKLRCDSFAEKFLIPAFVFFFAMLYPFDWVNRKDTKIAAAAGGCMLVKCHALEQGGGIDAVRHEIIDDCALARRMKAQGPIWLGLTDRARSLRRYPAVADVGKMIARSAYAQLHYSPLILIGTLIGMVVVYLAPVAIALIPTIYVGLESAMTGASIGMAMALAFQPYLSFYKRSVFWGLALPLIAMVYAWYTLQSAIQYWSGRGGMWKGRAQAWTKA
jgi:hopene-associated glycosyltransferase HpnB